MAVALSAPEPRSNPVGIRFGRRALDGLAALIGDRSCLLLASVGQRRRGIVDVVEALIGSRLRATYADVTPHPTVESVSQAIRELAPIQAEVIVAVGGGSVIDTAKAVASERGAASSDTADKLWVVGHLRDGDGFPGGFAPPRIIAIPTTAGSGSEVTPWATIWDEKPARKYSLCHDTLFPQWAIVDPNLTSSLPEAVTISGGLDALSHAVESLWSRWADPVSNALAARAVSLLPDALRGLIASPDSSELRSRACEGAMLAGLASSRTRTALAHSISYPFTAELGLPHGLACSFALPELIELNAAGAPGSVEVLVEAFGARNPVEAAAVLDRLFVDLAVGERVAKYVSGRSVVSELAGPLLTPSRAGNNPVALDEAAARRLAERALNRIGVR